MKRKPVAFPSPIKQPEGRLGRIYFRYAEVVHYIDWLAGDPARELTGDDLTRLISQRNARHLFGGVSNMWMWRRQNEAKGRAA